MEASLFLSYAAACSIFSAGPRWTMCAAGEGMRCGAGLFFVLGFMTKFVAALFLPFTLGLAALAFPRVRKRLIEDWRAWLGVAAVVFLLCAPWFIYAQVRFGSQLWETILGEHVLRRMTGFLDPTHVHPWNWYVQQMWQEFVNERMQWLIAAGLLVLFVQTDPPPLVRGGRGADVGRPADGDHLGRHVEAVSLRVSVSSARRTRGGVPDRARRHARTGAAAQGARVGGGPAGRPLAFALLRARGVRRSVRSRRA